MTVEARAVGTQNEGAGESGQTSALLWARMLDRVRSQDWPAGALYVVATPIGNLGDLGLRAWQALSQADVVAAEDTRATRVLFDAWGLTTPLMAAHRHNEAGAAQNIVARLQEGARVALVSDAGAPAVSDPGARIVREVRAAGLRVIPVPGASAVISALMASGATSDENPAFLFAGFAPSKATARQNWLRQWGSLPAPVVLFESPHRLAAMLDDMLALFGAARQVTVARELTKRYEQVETLALEDAAAWLAQDAHRLQGEFVLVLHEAPTDAADQGGQALEQADELLSALLRGVSVRDAARLAAQALGLPRDVLYARALALKQAD